jgi:hypothetical protein
VIELSFRSIDEQLRVNRHVRDLERQAQLLDEERHIDINVVTGEDQGKYWHAAEMCAQEILYRAEVEAQGGSHADELLFAPS